MLTKERYSFPDPEKICQITTLFCDRVSKKCWSLFKHWKTNDMGKQYVTMRQM